MATTATTETPSTSETAYEATVWDVYESPLGPLTLHLGPRGLRSLSFPRRDGRLDQERRSRTALAPAIDQLEEYFAGDRRRFDLAVDVGGDGLERRVWDELLTIPYGTTTTYGELAGRVGHEDPRDIGAAVGSTPVPIVIPCHRVIGSDGTLTGYGGGLHRKEALLVLEHRHAAGERTLPPWAHRQLDLL